MTEIFPVALSLVIVIGACWWFLDWLHDRVEPDTRSDKCPHCGAVIVVPYRAEVRKYQARPWIDPDLECQFCGVLITLHVGPVEP